MISISGNILSAIIDEANSCPPDSIQQGILFGSKSCMRTEVQSDTQEDKVVDEYLVGKVNIREIISSEVDSTLTTIKLTIIPFLGITSYINLRTRHSFWSESNKINAPDVLVDRDDIVGLLVVRRDGMKNPSIRDLAVASYLSRREVSAMYPFLVLIISICSDQSSWVFGMNFVCYGLFAHSPM